MASLRKAKKQAKKEGRIFIDPTKKKSVNDLTKEQLYKYAKASVKETNRRLKELDKKGFYNSFSSKKLFERLGSGKIDALAKQKNKVLGIKIKKNMSASDLTGILRATRSFLGGATSSVSKTRKVIKQTKKSMYKTLKLKDDKLTMEDIENYYDMLGDKDFEAFNDKIGASEMWAVIEDSIEAGDNQNQFLKRLNTLITLNDVDYRKKAINIFNKYV